MEDYFLLRNLTHAVITWVVGIILTFTNVVYIAMHIYVAGYSLVIPTTLMIIGIILLAWSSYRIAVMGREND
ncbi:hypothetical protein [Commensalibacter nepenthis]|uniref:Uncharacterized protein n=1 Tax=Commensalibacter nepenthis TaxID=3043872 RepID=A0ABT6Q7P7_9PROT|nr:hypothetical protein [Commensalibacter sp. TBRC 10068]MDI2112907.1 hypothetical protein [Commensalibacter sp. TBRC 10068]